MVGGWTGQHTRDDMDKPNDKPRFLSPRQRRALGGKNPLSSRTRAGISKADSKSMIRPWALYSGERFTLWQHGPALGKQLTFSVSHIVKSEPPSGCTSAISK